MIRQQRWPANTYDSVSITESWPHPFQHLRCDDIDNDDGDEDNDDNDDKKEPLRRQDLQTQNCTRPSSKFYQFFLADHQKYNSAHGTTNLSSRVALINGASSTEEKDAFLHILYWKELWTKWCPLLSDNPAIWVLPVFFWGGEGV